MKHRCSYIQLRKIQTPFNPVFKSLQFVIFKKYQVHTIT